MQAAASRVTAAGIQGSSTCCIVLLDTRHGRLASANVGDSGFMILGVTHTNPKPHVKFRTPQQEHQFGCPYQLGHHTAADPPEDAMLTTLPVRPEAPPLCLHAVCPSMEAVKHQSVTACVVALHQEAHERWAGVQPCTAFVALVCGRWPDMTS